MSVLGERRPRTAPRRRRKRLRVAAVVLALVVAGLVYAWKVTGLEVPLPGGVPVIVIGKPVGSPPPPTADALMDTLTTLAEENLGELGYPDYDHDRHRVVVNIATEAGEALCARVEVPDGVDVVVRHDAHSVSDFDRMTRLLFDEIDAIMSTSVDSINDRLVVTVRWAGPGLLRKLHHLVGPGVVAVRWAPLEQEMHAM